MRYLQAVSKFYIMCFNMCLTMIMYLSLLYLQISGLQWCLYYLWCGRPWNVHYCTQQCKHTCVFHQHSNWTNFAIFPMCTVCIILYQSCTGVYLGSIFVFYVATVTWLSHDICITHAAFEATVTNKCWPPHSVLLGTPGCSPGICQGRLGVIF